ncbi:hypothetical protein [Pelagicoccus mobilis]|nr:hypothetical protein [Pelagicoccus mobilis]
MSSLLVRAQIEPPQGSQSLATRVSDGFGGSRELRFGPNRFRLPFDTP